MHFPSPVGLHLEQCSIQVVFLCVLLAVAQPSAAMKGPPRAERSEVRLVVKLGDEAKLRCPVEAHPPPTVTWSKGEETIDYSWVRFRQNRKMLKIRGVERGDTGAYYCKGINGFGKAEVRLDLIVIDPADFPHLTESELPLLSPPVFTAAYTRDTVQQLVRDPGQSVSLNCDAAGRPSPRVSWYKNSELFRDTGSTLVLRDVSSKDAGTYTCTVQNILGSITAEFNLQIRGEVARPSIVYGPMNLTVEQGITAHLDCRVRSAQPPAIKWLRKLTDVSAAVMYHEVVSVNGNEQYELIQTSRLTEVGSGDFLSQLDLEGVQPSHSGLYVCFVTSPDGGFNVRPAYVNVIKKTGVSDDSVPVTVLVASLGVVLLSVAVFTLLCCLQRRGRRATKPASARAETKEHHHIYKPSEMKLVVNQLDDLLNHNTQELEPPATKYPCGGGYEENPYEVPHVLPSNLRGSVLGYYESRDGIPPSYYSTRQTQ